jgi:WD40 repeat protein
VQTLAFTPDGRTFLSGGADGTVRQWDTTSGRQVAAWRWEIGPINAVAVAPDGQTAACGGDKSAVVVWDLDA